MLLRLCCISYWSSNRTPPPPAWRPRCLSRPPERPCTHQYLTGELAVRLDPSSLPDQPAPPGAGRRRSELPQPVNPATSSSTLPGWRARYRRHSASDTTNTTTTARPAPPPQAHEHDSPFYSSRLPPARPSLLAVLHFIHVAYRLGRYSISSLPLLLPSPLPPLLPRPLLRSGPASASASASSCSVEAWLWFLCFAPSRGNIRLGILPPSYA